MKPFFNSLPGQALAAVLCAGLFAALAGPASAQQYKNFEITPDRRGGATGTYGNRNFEIERDYSRPSSGYVGEPRARQNPAPNKQTRCYLDSATNTRRCR